MTLKTCFISIVYFHLSQPLSTYSARQKTCFDLQSLFVFIEKFENCIHFYLKNRLRVEEMLTLLFGI